MFKCFVSISYSGSWRLVIFIKPLFRKPFRCWSDGIKVVPVKHFHMITRGKVCTEIDTDINSASLNIRSCDSHILVKFEDQGQVIGQSSKSQEENVPFSAIAARCDVTYVWLLVELFVQKWSVRPRVRDF